MRPETRQRPHQNSQYDAFPSQARDQCFTRLVKMRRNTVTYWTKADFANREACSFIRLNDAFRKTLLQEAKKKTRKLTDHGKQLLPLALISNVIVFYDKERIVGNDRLGRAAGGGGGGWGRCKQHIKHMFFDLMQLVRGVFY